LVVFARVAGVAQQDAEERFIAVYPERGTGPARVAHGPPGGQKSFRAVHPRVQFPAQPLPRVRGHLAAARHLIQRLLRQHLSLQEGAAEAREIAGRAEKAGMAGYAAHGIRIFVVDLAHHDAAPPAAALGGGGCVTEIAARAEPGVFHFQRRKNPVVTEVVQPVTGGQFDDFAQDNKSEVRIPAPGAGRPTQLERGNTLQHCVHAFHVMVKGFVGGQAAGVG